MALIKFRVQVTATGWLRPGADFFRRRQKNPRRLSNRNEIITSAVISPQTRSGCQATTIIMLWIRSKAAAHTCDVVVYERGIVFGVNY
jgi:hypothetical protein